MNAFLTSIEWVMGKLRIIGAICLVGMMSLTCADVFARYFHHPIFGSVELVSIMATLAVPMALPHTHKIGGHVGVEIVVRLLSEKTQTIIKTCTDILSLGLFALVTWRMMAYARDLQLTGEVSMNLEIPFYYVIYTTGFCLLVFTLVIFYDLVDDIRKLKGK
ncbi:MAG: TRAP transporter small permease [Deltaproteobacteria bacterium]|nr:MAG: TRAP transporter small permease [Deltaproteobacteria bacterium]